MLEQTAFDPQHYVRDYTRASKSNFSASFLFLPSSRARAMEALYAYCRAVDDAVDEPPAGATPQDLLRFWRGEIQLCYSAVPTHPIAIALQRAAIQPFQMTRAHLEGILTGMEMDLHASRYDTWKDLETYCYHVAGEVGLASMEIFGFKDSRHRDYAVALGEAFQLTNILRDIGVDAAKGRIYLPQEALRQYGATEADILGRRMTPELKTLFGDLAARAESRYSRASSLLDPSDSRPLIAARMMNAVYHRILKKLKRRDFPVFESPRIGLNRFEKLAVTLWIWCGGQA